MTNGEEASCEGQLLSCERKSIVNPRQGKVDVPWETAHLFSYGKRDCSFNHFLTFSVISDLHVLALDTAQFSQTEIIAHIHIVLFCFLIIGSTPFSCQPNFVVFYLAEQLINL